MNSENGILILYKLRMQEIKQKLGFMNSENGILYKRMPEVKRSSH